MRARWPLRHLKGFLRPACARGSARCGDSTALVDRETVQGAVELAIVAAIQAPAVAATGSEGASHTPLTWRVCRQTQIGHRCPSATHIAGHPGLSGALTGPPADGAEARCLLANRGSGAACGSSPDKEEVGGSSPPSPTVRKPRFGGGFSCLEPAAPQSGGGLERPIWQQTGNGRSLESPDSRLSSAPPPTFLCGESASAGTDGALRASMRAERGPIRIGRGEVARRAPASRRRAPGAGKTAVARPRYDGFLGCGGQVI